MENEELVWWKEENKDLQKVYPFIGEYLVSFNFLVEQIEILVLELTNPFKRGYSSRATGTFFKAQSKKLDLDSLVNIFASETERLIQRSIHVKSIKALRKAYSERKRIIDDLQYINEWRNFFIHSFWHDWTDEYPYIKKSVPANQKIKGKIKTSKSGRNYLKIPIDEFKNDITYIEKTCDRLFNFEQKYRYGTDDKGKELSEEKLTPQRKKQLDQYYKNRIPWNKKGFKNLGTSTIIWLQRLEIGSNEELKKIGPEKTYKLLIADGHVASKRLLYSLIGSAEGKDWREVAKNRK